MTYEETQWVAVVIVALITTASIVLGIRAEIRATTRTRSSREATATSHARRASSSATHCGSGSK